MLLRAHSSTTFSTRPSMKCLYALSAMIFVVTKSKLPPIAMPASLKISFAALPAKMNYCKLTPDPYLL